MNLTPLDKAAIEAEYNLIVKTLKKTKFNKTKAAEILQIDRRTLYNKLEAHDKMVASSEVAGESIPETY